MRQVKKFSLCKIVKIIIGGKTQFENLLNNYSIRPCWIRTRWLFYHFSYPTGAHGIIVIYFPSGIRLSNLQRRQFVELEAD